MLELLKKIGLPATVAAIIASLITLLPILFKIDERYAKAEELEAQIEKVESDINELSIELGKLAGTQQVLVSIMSVKVNSIERDMPEREPTPPAVSSAKPQPVTSSKPPEPVVEPLPTTPPADITEAQRQLDIVSRSLVQTQRKSQQINESYQNKK